MPLMRRGVDGLPLVVPRHIGRLWADSVGGVILLPHGDVGRHRLQPTQRLEAGAYLRLATAVDEEVEEGVHATDHPDPGVEHAVDVANRRHVET